MIELIALALLHLLYIAAAAAIYARVQHGDEQDSGIEIMVRVGGGIIAILVLGMLVDGGIAVRLLLRYRTVPPSVLSVLIAGALVAVVSFLVATYVYRRVDRALEAAKNRHDG